MNKKLLLVVIVVIEICLYLFINPSIKQRLKHIIDINRYPNIDNIKLDNYVIGVVAAEMPATFSFEALKAQAVASRTFIYRKIIDGNISYDYLNHDKGQAYLSNEELKERWKNNYDIYYNIIKKAVTDTNGEIITYNSNPIKAYYFSSSNGVTEDSKYVFGEESYLISVDSSFDKDSKEYEKEILIDKKSFYQKLELNDSVLKIDNVERNRTNHIEKITINDKLYSGIEIRKKLGLRSTDFDISVNNDNVKIITRGYGHGVGMSQYGANYLASNGKTYKEIINYYYNDVNITKIQV